MVTTFYSAMSKLAFCGTKVVLYGQLASAPFRSRDREMSFHRLHYQIMPLSLVTLLCFTPNPGQANKWKLIYILIYILEMLLYVSINTGQVQHSNLIFIKENRIVKRVCPFKTLTLYNRQLWVIDDLAVNRSFTHTNHRGNCWFDEVAHIGVSLKGLLLSWSCDHYIRRGIWPGSRLRVQVVPLQIIVFWWIWSHRFVMYMQFSKKIKQIEVLENMYAHEHHSSMICLVYMGLNIRVVLWLPIKPGYGYVKQENADIQKLRLRCYPTHKNLSGEVFSF